VNNADGGSDVVASYLSPNGPIQPPDEHVQGDFSHG